MRLTLQAFGHTLEIGLACAPENSDDGPTPSGTQCGDLSLAEDPGEDVRMASKTYMPLGFARGRGLSSSEPAQPCCDPERQAKL